MKTMEIQLLCVCVLLVCILGRISSSVATGPVHDRGTFSRTNTVTVINNIPLMPPDIIADITNRLDKLEQIEKRRAMPWEHRIPLVTTNWMEYALCENRNGLLYATNVVLQAEER